MNVLGRTGKYAIMGHYHKMQGVISYDNTENSGNDKNPLLKDNTCYFLAIDFDEDDWFDAMLSVYRVAKRYGIDSLMERSKSGNGGHLWIFFDNNIYASYARKLGFFLLDEAMKVNKRITFKSFDRLFPNQDTMPIGGFGNLIA